MTTTMGPRNRSVRLWLGAVWLVLVLFILAWQFVGYRGLAATIAEWEYRTIGNFHPALTYLLLLCVLALPLILLRPRKATRSSSNESGAGNSKGINVILIRFLALLGGGALIVASFLAIYAATLPNDDGAIRSLKLSDPNSQPLTGPVDLEGKVRFDQISVLNQSFLSLKYATRFAPIEGDQYRGSIRYFVELPPQADLPAKGASNVYRGVMREGGLPGDLLRLYRFAGLDVSPDYHVLFASVSSMRHAYVAQAIEFLLLAAGSLFLSGLLVFMRHRQLAARRRQAKEALVA